MRSNQRQDGQNNHRSLLLQFYLHRRKKWCPESKCLQSHRQRQHQWLVCPQETVLHGPESLGLKIETMVKIQKDLKEFYLPAKAWLTKRERSKRRVMIAPCSQNDKEGQSSCLLYTYCQCSQVLTGLVKGLC